MFYGPKIAAIVNIYELFLSLNYINGSNLPPGYACRMPLKISLSCWTPKTSFSGSPCGT